MEREKYFGLMHEGEMADVFAAMALGKEKRGEPVTKRNSRKVKVKSSVSTAEQLYAYMTFRAAREQQAHDFTIKDYQAHLDAGIRTFFGIEVGPEGLEADMRQPQLFAEWRGNHARK